MYLFYHCCLIATTKALTKIVLFSIPAFMRTLTRDFFLQKQFVTKAARHCGAIIAPVLFLTFSKETGQKQYGWCKKCDVMRVEMMPFAGLKLCFSDRRPPSLEMSFCSSWDLMDAFSSLIFFFFFHSWILMFSPQGVFYSSGKKV